MATARKKITLADIKGSRSFRELNPGLLSHGNICNLASQLPASMPLEPKQGDGSQKAARPGKRRKQMNKTETEFSMILQRQAESDEIVSWGYEETTLRWGRMDNIQYTPDFTVIETSYLNGAEDYPHLRIIYIEVKGGHIRAKDIQKFKAARNQFTRFEFQLWQKKNREWKQLL